MGSEFDTLKLVTERLEQSGIKYMLTGSFAGNFYAVPRMTRDIDIVIEILRPHVDQICNIFKDDFCINKEAIINAIEHEGMFNIVHVESVMKIDFIIRKSSIFRNTEFQRRQRIQFGNNELWIVSLEDLILSKLIWAKDTLSNTHLRDIHKLLNCSKYLNQEYLQKWVKDLSLDQIYATAAQHE